jgi:UDP-N-acetylglucosamine 4-epimerase
MAAVSFDVAERLSQKKSGRWLVTGAAGFIGSNLVERLLASDQPVVGIDDFSTGHRHNLDLIRSAVGEKAWARFELIEGDICDPDICARGMSDVDVVLHQAALGSVPRSIDSPMRSFRANATGFAQLLTSAKDAGVKRFVYASSSSVYGDHPELPKIEHRTGRPLSPYAATKAIDETVAQAWSHSYGISCVGLRYFNVFGPRQDPDGAYAAVIPRWIAALLRGEPIYVNGDGSTSRDFCYVENAIQANLRAALVAELPSRHEVFNVATGRRSTLLALLTKLQDLARSRTGREADVAPVFCEFRSGDVQHSLADISKATALLGYSPSHDLEAGLESSLNWYVKDLAPG